MPLFRSRVLSMLLAGGLVIPGLFADLGGPADLGGDSVYKGITSTCLHRDVGQDSEFTIVEHLNNETGGNLKVVKVALHQPVKVELVEAYWLKSASDALTSRSGWINSPKPVLLFDSPAVGATLTQHARGADWTLVARVRVTGVHGDDPLGEEPVLRWLDVTYQAGGKTYVTRSGHAYILSKECNVSITPSTNA